MGIPSYFSKIVKKCPSMVKNLTKERKSFNHLYMDCNSIVYDAVRKLDSGSPDFENKLIDQVIFNIDGYINQVKPKNTVFIAFDGVAPFAKMNQQKTRRYKSAFMANNDFVEPVKPGGWSTSNITPGTKFMDNLSLRLTTEFKNKERKYSVDAVIFSGSNDVGEGEHKIFNHARGVANVNDNMIIYGLDSDLIMLSIFHTRLFKHIYVFREAPEFMKSSIDVGKSDDPYLLDISMLCNSILNEIDPKFLDKQRVMDYAFMCFLLGNDFLPHFPALNIRTHGIDTLLTIYSKVIGNHSGRYFISPSNTIQWHNFKLLIAELAKNETIYITEEYASRNKYDKRTWKTETKADREMALLNMPMIHRVEEKYICPDINHWEERYYTALFEMERKPIYLDKICTNYLEGLEWTFKYYIGDCPDWRWSYEYHYPPLFVDLNNYIPNMEKSVIKRSRGPFTPNVQLAYVLPPAQFDLLPEKTRTYLQTNFSQYYSDSIEFQWAFCRYFWEAHVKFKEVDVKILDEWDKHIS